MNKLPITVCMVSGAEAGRIGRALESVASWASEIVVLLNEEVRDGTEEIALRHGAKVYREPWKGFIAQKNSASEKATQPWLLNLDADEVVPPELMSAIARAIASPSAQDVYEFPRCTYYCGRWIRHGDWYPDHVRRLWRKGKSRWVGQDPHASLEINGSLGRLHADLLHYTNETLNRQVAKTVAYADNFAANCARDKKRAGALELAVRPLWRFFRGYFIKLGFLDGWQGFAIAWMTAFYTFLRYARVREDETNNLAP